VHLSVNWSDESFRKMSSKITLTGTGGRISADRQELQAFLRAPAPALPDYHEGWNVKYTTELTNPVRFYLRGEEYSAQIEDFVDAVADGRARTPNDFASAAETDRTMALMLDDQARERAAVPDAPAAPAARPAPARRRAWFRLGAVR
jgi:predicted dehydrogenase